jgi:hypothetical protein
MSRESRDIPIYAPLFTEGAFQEWLDRTAGDYLHRFLGKGAESQIMDQAFGLGHRLKAGHDLQGLLDLVKDQGVDGACTWFQHMFADLMSPDGIPLPGAAPVYRFLEDTVGVSERFFIDWTCVSATDVVSGGVSLLILARIYKLATERGRIRRLAGLTVGQILLVSLAEANPFFLATIPLQALLMRHEWRKWQLRRLEERLLLSEHVANQAASLLKQVKGEA